MAKSLGLELTSTVADGGVAHILDTAVAYTSGTLLSVRENGGEQFAVKDAGNTEVGGTLAWGGGSTIADSDNVALLDADQTFTNVKRFNRESANAAVITGRLSGGRTLRINADGEILWGASASDDTNLYRDSANILKTDDAFTVVGAATLDTGANGSSFGGALTIDGSLFQSTSVETGSIFIGGSGGTVTTATKSIAIGSGALDSVTEAGGNVAIGADALKSATTGSGNNVAIGTQALTANTSGFYNFALGLQALVSSTTGTENVAIGIAALGQITTTDRNIGLGRSAGLKVSGGANHTTGDNSVFIGYDTRANADGESNQIVIGSQAIGQGANTAMIGNSSVTDVYLAGDIRPLSDPLGINANDGTERIAINSTGLGLFGATPVAQPTTGGTSEATFVENGGGTAVNVDSTFGGYTLQQIAQALQDLGALA